MAITLDRSVAPYSDAISKPNFPTADSIQLSNGLPLLGLFNNQQPVLMLDLIIPIGRFEEKIFGLNYMVAKMLLEGTRTKSSTEIANELDFHGSHLEITPTLDHIFIRLYCLKKFFQNQVDLVFEMLTEPSFSPVEFEKVKGIRIQQTKQQHAKTNAYSGLKFREVLYGSEHPYGIIMETEEVAKTELDAVKSFYTDELFITPNLYLAGDYSQKEIDIIDQRIKSIVFKTPPTSSLKEVNTGKNIYINWPNSVQSSIRLGSKIIDRSHPDIHQLKIANELFGGFFGSRLMKNIREEKGLTYGISSSLVHLKNESYWVVGTDVLKEKTKLAIAEIKKEIVKIQKNTPSSDEVNTLKNYLKGKWLMSFDSVFSSMNRITNNHLAGLDDRYWHDFIDAVDSTTPEQISATVNKYLNPDTVTEVTVG